LPTNPGSVWDLVTDPDAEEGTQGQVGLHESAMNYSEPLDNTLDRIESDMADQVDVPDVSADALKGVVSSGKTLKAIYWPLMVRCNEKFLNWQFELERLVKILIDGAKLYPLSTINYTQQSLSDAEYDVAITNQYPIMDDVADEKDIDMAEVTGQTMSRKAYMIKWRGLTDDEAQEELKQIAMERQMLENSYMNNQFGRPSNDNEPNEDDDLEDEE
jgi:hypothetical protein